ncbi:hypothetical protein CKN63_12880 [Carnobacterium divergens]|nr:hypothetical protein CUR52_15970 [Enterococcus faecalis]TFI60618.1 hypothetical protein CKN76_13435 [Carnobacterium divergens]TFI61616.1 hypothetical protein CKN59_12445 [Carnobacterium divergens]TFI77651.1 hypothetical protein CKN74_12345 [Carnobacterium divergens]TFJ00697.1 hypothetical protein CKN75_13125 [Carnobacterium divergens]
MRKKLPQTGEENTLGLTVIGLILLIIIGGYYFYHKKLTHM